MAKLIDTDKLFRAIRDDAEISSKTFARVKEHIFNAEDEVVRCKDCKHTKNMAPIGESKYLLGECFLREEDDITFMVYDDDFCSYGERRTE